MKTKFRYLLFFMSLFLITTKAFALPTEVTITKEYLNDIYFNKIVTGTLHWGQFPRFKAGNEVIYCIEPGIPIRSLTYNLYTDWSATSIDEEKRKELELIGYYGYSYPNHQTTNYLLATQKLIWEALGIETVYYTTQSYGQGTIINIDNCVNEINNLIAAHYYKPSFDNVTLTGALNTGFILIDSNNEIGNFPFLNLNGNELTIADNQVAVRLLNQDSNNVTLSKLNKITTNIYKSDLSQTLARLGTTNIQVDSIINLNVIKGVINLNSIENNQFKGDSTLENAVYEISNGDLFKVQLRTDQAGNLTMPSLANGDYLIKQLTPSLGYLPNPAEYQASITRDNPTCNIELNNQLIQSEVVINAYLNDETLNTCQQAALISFGIYHNDTLIYTIETNETGLASILLPYGEYTIKQLTNLTDYEMSEEFNVSINNAMEDYQEYNIAINKIIPPLNETDSKVKPTIIQTTNPIIPKATIELNKDKIKANPIVEPSKSIKKSVIITKKEPKHVKKSDVKDKSKLNLKKSDLSISFIIIIIGIIIVYINRKYRNSY